MDIEKLLAVFPQARLGEKRAGELAFGYKDSYFNVPEESVTERERKMLGLCFGADDCFEVSRGEWQDYLTRDGRKPAKRGKIRFVQYEIHGLNHEQVDMELFRRAFSAMFPKEPAAVFALAENRGVAVEKVSAASFDKDEFEGIIQALDADFGAKCRVFIGHIWTAKDNLKELFADEQRVFETEHPAEQVFDLAEVSLHYYCHRETAGSTLAEKYHDMIAGDPQLKSIVSALYHEKGNVSSAAKELYLHRNTLQYRIDKLRQETGINLKRMDDLVFCYLMLQ